MTAYQHTEPHPLSENLHFAVAGDASPLDAGLVLLSIALEGVLKTGFPTVAVPDDSLGEQVDAACKLVSGSELSDTFKKRAIGSLNSMRASRAKDKLLALQKAGVIREELIRAWEDIRNASVHAEILDKTAIAKIYHKYQCVLTLLNELVFLVVGYTGQYTDYSVAGWPLRTFEKTMRDVDNDAVALRQGAS